MEKEHIEKRISKQIYDKESNPYWREKDSNVLISDLSDSELQIKLSILQKREIKINFEINKLMDKTIICELLSDAIKKEASYRKLNLRDLDFFDPSKKWYFDGKRIVSKMNEKIVDDKKITK